ncbi:MAG TPA: hypothetical protein PKK23_04420 [Nitrospirales bacterium]|nr:hypothetical protein [Nitrospirales bacterium]
MESSPLSLNTTSKKAGEDPFTRLTLAVRELDKLINRANQLAHLSEPTQRPDHPTSLDRGAPPKKT